MQQRRKYTILESPKINSSIILCIAKTKPAPQHLLLHYFVYSIK
jgi:hypothetical protein